MAKNKVYVIATYSCSIGATVELPEGKTWGDVKEYWIKWSNLHIVFKDGTEIEIDMGVNEDGVDLKRPDRVSVYDGGIDGPEISEQ